MFDGISILKFIKTKINTQCLLLGAHVPLTMEGNVIVDGVLASCYPSTHHDLAHLGMAPIRWFPQLIMLIFGEDNGFSVYLTIIEDFGKFTCPYVQQYISYF